MDPISLNSDNYNSNLVSSLDHFKALNSFVDVTLVCEGHTVKAHKIILSAGSNVLHRLLLANPAKDPIIILTETKYDTLRMIIEFLYTGKVDVPRNDLKKLLAIAITFEMNELKKLCEENVEKACRENLNSRNVDSEPNAHPRSKSPDLIRSSPNKKRQRRQSSDSDILDDGIVMKQEICDSPSGWERPEVSNTTDLRTESAGFHPQIEDTVSLNRASAGTFGSDSTGGRNQRDASTECDVQPLKELKSNLAPREPTRVKVKPRYNEQSDDSGSEAPVIQSKFFKRKRRSRIWQYYTAVSSSYAVCKLCCRKLSYKTTVTNLTKHLLKKHRRFDPKNPPKLPDVPLLRIQNEELEIFEEIDFNSLEEEAGEEEASQNEYEEEALEEGVPSTSTPCIMKIS